MLKEYSAVNGDEDDGDMEDGKTEDNQQDILDTENIAIIYGSVDEETDMLMLEALASVECEICEIYVSKDGGEYQLIGNTDEYGYLEYPFADDFSSMEIYAVCYGVDGQKIESNRIEIYIEEGIYTIPNPDTDSDGLDDYYELFICYTDHRLSDSDENGIVDGEEDLDDDGITNLANAKNVVTNYIDNSRSNDIHTKVGIVAFREYSYIKCDLTSDYDLAIQSVNELSAYGGTNIYSGLNNAISTLFKNREESYNVIILLTDGSDASDYSDTEYDMLLIDARVFGIDIYSIGIGDVDDELLIKISNFGNGKYYYTDDSSGLYQIYEDVEGEAADYITDSNHDGISDYYTKLLCEGKLRIGTQGNIFEGISYAKVNACNDYDGDGLINGEELKIYRDEKTGYVYAYLYSNPFLRDSDGDGIIDSKDEAPLDSWSGLIIYESPKTDDNLKNGSDRPEDYEYGDKSKSKLLDMKHITYSDFSDKDKDYYISSWKSIAIDYSDGDMTSVALDMVNHSLDGTGSDYSNEILTENVIEHKSSKAYVKDTKKCVIEHIEENNGNIYGLYYDVSNRDASVVKEYFRKNRIYEPNFSDPKSGLGFSLHGLYGNQIEITSYRFDGTKYECTLKFTYYDVFGLDSDDIEKNGAFVIKFGKIEGFRSWYILQHYDKYKGEVKPFITYVSFEETIKGEIN